MSDCRTEREQLWEGASFRIRRMARGCPGRSSSVDGAACGHRRAGGEGLQSPRSKGSGVWRGQAWRGGTGAAGWPLPAPGGASSRGLGLQVGPSRLGGDGARWRVCAPRRGWMKSACAQERAPSPGLCVRLSAGSWWPWVPAPRRVSVRTQDPRSPRATAVSHAPGRARAASPACPRPPPVQRPPSRVCPAERRRRLCEEARPGAGGRRQTTTSTTPNSPATPCTSQAGGWGAGQ